MAPGEEESSSARFVCCFQCIYKVTHSTHHLIRRLPEDFKTSSVDTNSTFLSEAASPATSSLTANSWCARTCADVRGPQLVGEHAALDVQQAAVAARVEEVRGEGQELRQRRDAAADDQVEAARALQEGLGATRHHAHIAQAQPRRHVLHHCHLLRAAVQQGEMRVWVHDGEGQPRQAAAGAHVDHSRAWRKGAGQGHRHRRHDVTRHQAVYIFAGHHIDFAVPVRDQAR